MAGVLFVTTPFALYFSGWYEATLRNPVLHELNHVHFVLVGCLWFWPILSVDPLPNRMPYPLRLLAVFATMPLHAFLGVAIMTLVDGHRRGLVPRGWTGTGAPARSTTSTWAAGCSGPAATSCRSSSSGRCSCSGRGRRSARRSGRTGASTGWTASATGSAERERDAQAAAEPPAPGR